MSAEAKRCHCRYVYELEHLFFNCVLEADHSGEHRDAYGHGAQGWFLPEEPLYVEEMRERLVGAEAACAALRAAMHEVLFVFERHTAFAAIENTVRAALAADAGERFLEQIAKADALAVAAERVDSLWHGPTAVNTESIMIKNALAAYRAARGT